MAEHYYRETDDGPVFGPFSDEDRDQVNSSAVRRIVWSTAVTLDDMVCPGCGLDPSHWQTVAPAFSVNRHGELSDDRSALVFSASADYVDEAPSSWVECGICLTRIELPDGLNLDYS
jgi:hypothetical protein